MGECDALRRMDHDHFGRPFTLTDQVVSSYPGFLPSRNGMVLLDLADEVLDSAATYQRLHQQMTVHVFEGGNHRFMHMQESLPLIGGFLGHTDGTERLLAAY